MGLKIAVHREPALGTESGGKSKYDCGGHW